MRRTPLIALFSALVLALIVSLAGTGVSAESVDPVTESADVVLDEPAPTPPEVSDPAEDLGEISVEQTLREERIQPCTQAERDSINCPAECGCLCISNMPRCQC